MLRSPRILAPRRVIQHHHKIPSSHREEQLLTSTSVLSFVPRFFSAYGVQLQCFHLAVKSLRVADQEFSMQRILPHPHHRIPQEVRSNFLLRSRNVFSCDEIRCSTVAMYSILERAPTYIQMVLGGNSPQSRSLSVRSHGNWRRRQFVFFVLVVLFATFLLWRLVEPRQKVG